MNREEIIELAARKAVGDLEGDDARELDLRLERADDQTRAEVAELAEAGALLGLAQSTPCRPPNSIKTQILSEIQSRQRSFTSPTPNPFYFIGNHEGDWVTLPVPGVRVKELSVNTRTGTSVKLYELAAGARFPEHHHSGAEECYVLSGDFHVEGCVMQGGDFHHAEANSDHRESFTENGCTLLVVATSADYQAH